MTDEKNQLIETFDDEGNKVLFELVDIVTVDNTEYALLLPQDEQKDEENEILVMRLKQDGEEYAFEVIEDDNEFDKVAQYIEEIEEQIDD